MVGKVAAVMMRCRQTPAPGFDEQFSLILVAPPGLLDPTLVRPLVRLVSGAVTCHSPGRERRSHFLAGGGGRAFSAVTSISAIKRLLHHLGREAPPADLDLNRRADFRSRRGQVGHPDARTQAG